MSILYALQTDFSPDQLFCVWLQRPYFEHKLFECKIETLPHYVLRRLRLELPVLRQSWRRPTWIGNISRAHVAEVDGLDGKRESCGRRDLRSSGECSSGHITGLLNTDLLRFPSDGWFPLVMCGARATKYSMCWWSSQRCYICVDSGRLWMLFVLRRIPVDCDVFESSTCTLRQSYGGEMVIFRYD